MTSKENTGGIAESAETTNQHLEASDSSISQLIIEECDIVRLRDGTVARVVDLTAPGEAYLMEVPTPGGPSPYDWFTALHGDIAEVLPDDYPMPNPYERRY